MIVVDGYVTDKQYDYMFRIFISVWLLFLAVPNPASANTDLPTPDVVGCLKAIEPLDLRYRGWMQLQCISVAGDICVALDKGTGSCLSELVASMRNFYVELAALLPETIEGSGFQVSGYERALERAAETFEDVPECSELSGYELTTCQYIQFGATTTDLFYRARMANVPLP